MMSLSRIGPVEWDEEVKPVNKLKSRKFWMAVVAGALVIVNQGLDLNLPEDAVNAVAGIVISYILGQAYVDSKSA